MITNNFLFLSDQNSWLKDKLRIRKAKTETRHISLVCEDPENPGSLLLPSL